MGNTQTKLPEKNYFYQVKEHFADDFPVVNSLDGVELLKLKVDELFTDDQEALKSVGERLVKGLKEDNVVILQLNDEIFQKVSSAFVEAKKFLSQSQKKKEEFAAEKIEERRAFYSGYSLIHFDNRNNKRDEEWRDVFQIRYGEEGHIPWPSDSFKQSTQQLYEAEWSICVQALKAIGLALSIKPSDLLELAVGNNSNDNTSNVNVNDSANTNLSLFHYFDKLMSYKTPQKCMVHKDHGLLTLLPKTDVPGLELLHPQLKQWIPIENFIENTDVLLYCGEALQIVTDSKVEAAAHRVVRLPQKERYSMPFESKPNDNAVMRNLVNPESDPNPATFDGMTKRFQWERVMKQVNRADGIEPTESGDELKATEEPNENDIKPDFGQAQHDVQLPSISVK